MIHFALKETLEKRDEAKDLKLQNTIKAKLDAMPWINYYDDKDPISGHLDYYSVDDNVKLDLQKKWGVAHSGYWDDAQFYNDIAKRFL